MWISLVAVLGTVIAVFVGAFTTLTSLVVFGPQVLRAFPLLHFRNGGLFCHFFPLYRSIFYGSSLIATLARLGEHLKNTTRSLALARLVQILLEPRSCMTLCSRFLASISNSFRAVVPAC